MRTIRFCFLVDTDERRLITAVAEKLKRSQGDAIRSLIRTAAQELIDQSQNENADSNATGKDTEPAFSHISPKEYAK